MTFPDRFVSVADAVQWRDTVDAAIHQLDYVHPLRAGSGVDHWPALSSWINATPDRQRHYRGALAAAARARSDLTAGSLIPDSDTATRDLPFVVSARGWSNATPRTTYDLVAFAQDADARRRWAYAVAQDRSATSAARRKARDDARWLGDYVTAATDAVQASSGAWLPQLQHIATPATAPKPSPVGSW